MDNTVLVAIIAGAATLITGGIASIPGILALRAQKREIISRAEKSKAEAGRVEIDTVQVVQQMALELIEPYRKRVSELEEKVSKQNTDMQIEIDTLKQNNFDLQCQVEDMYACLLDVSDCAHKLYNQLVASRVTPECEPPTKEQVEEKIKAAREKRARKIKPTPAVI